MKKAGFLLNEKDKENLAVVKKIVSERFSLDDSSLTYFKEQIKNPEVSDLFFDAFEKAGSSRIVMNIPESIESEMDYSWKTFKGRFSYFVNETGFNFSNYKQNKIEIDKNILKPKKALINFYTKKIIELANDIAYLAKVDGRSYFNFIERQVDNIDYGDFSFLAYDYNATKSNLLGYTMTLCSLNNFNENDNENGLNKNDLISQSETRKKCLLESVENTITTEWQNCADSKISKDKLKLVISFNYADWFLCSTGEKWTSCLNLDGNSANYWYGLPGLMGDKNRVMIYLTRGERKTAYGIETDKYLFRTWALLDSDNKLNIVRWFPREDIGTTGLYELIEEKTGFTINKDYFMLNENDDFHSKYEVKLIYTTENFSLFPYLDYARFTAYDESFLVSGESGMYHKKKGERYIYSDEMCSYDDFSSLGDLIDNNTDICSARNSNCTCNRCGNYADEDDEYYNTDGDLLCTRCFESNYFICEHCGETYSNDEEFYVENVGGVCDSCFHDKYFYCELSNETFSLDDSALVTDDRYGNETFIAYYGVVEENGYILNETDDIYYKAEYMICDKNGDYIHVDEYDNQQELGLEEAV